MACAPSTVKVAAISLLVILCAGTQLTAVHGRGPALDVADGGEEDVGTALLRLVKPTSAALDELAQKLRQGWLQCSESCQTCIFVCACQNCECDGPPSEENNKCERDCIQRRGCESL
ncbi:hypothetical protein CFC21_074615 [Triticum aestivum]|uniref:Uncharacterized protein n=3 Tax=Triticum TaxID=4564 RepID=A0A9R0XM12_TRITD|nr:hypothetical protein CFC21_074615 [Triticum aestivum]VAI39325.1 unnamed protein product [Triticum turgidum subsp. durum]